MANTLKMNSACPASHVKCVLLMVLCFLFFFFLFLDNGNRATVFAGVQFIAETAYDQCCMLPTEPGYFTRAVLSQLYFF